MAEQKTIEEQVGLIKTGLFSLSQRVQNDSYIGCMNKDTFLKYLRDFTESNNEEAFAFQICIGMSEGQYKTTGNAQLELICKDIFSSLETFIGTNYDSQSGLLYPNTMIIICDEDISEEIKANVDSALKEDFPDFEEVFCRIGGTIVLPEDTTPTLLSRLAVAQSLCKTNKGTNLTLLTQD
jgi:hypothetical protein